jgi:hypothetical protein
LAFPNESLENKKLVLYPSDTLQFSQKILPLGLKIDKIGNQKRADDNAKFDVVLRDKNGRNITGTDTEEQFAPTQFFETETNKQLGKANFEKLKAGSKLLVDGYGNLEFDYLSEREVEYEKSIIDKKDDLILKLAPGSLSKSLFSTFSKSNAAAVSTLSVARNKTSALSPKGVKIKEKFAVINSLTGESVQFARSNNSFENLTQSVQSLIQTQPELEGVLEVIPQHELI